MSISWSLVNESTVASHSDLGGTAAGTSQDQAHKHAAQVTFFHLESSKRTNHVQKPDAGGPKVAAPAFPAPTSAVWIGKTYRFHYGWKTPLCAEQSLAVEASPFVDVPVQNVHADHAGVHGVGILLHSSFGHRFPRMAVDARKQF